MRKLDRLRIYEDFFHKMQLAEVCCDNDRLKEAFRLIWNWSYAHRAGNGEPTEYEQKQMVENVIRKMDKF